MRRGKEPVKIIEGAGCLICGLLGSIVIAGLFYRSWYAFPVLAVPFCILVTKMYGKYKRQKKKDLLLLEFKDAMQAVSASLLAGYSMENAWREAESEIKKQHGEDSMMYKELHQINAAVRMSRPLEKMLTEFAERSGCEDIMSFAEVFSFAKRSGGNYVEIIRTTVQKLSDRIEVEREIQTELAGKRFEGRIMDIMPVLIIAYLNVTSGEFMSVLYGNPAGVAVMSGALGLYIGAILLSERMMNIRV